MRTCCRQRDERGWRWFAVATAATTYTAAGDLLTVEDPLPGTADTTRYHYDAARAAGGGKRGPEREKRD